MNETLKKDKFTRKEKENIKSKIHNLTKESKIEIVKIIYTHNEKFSENSNGIMFDLMKLKIETLNDINNFLIYTINNSIDIEKTEIKINNYKELL